MRILPHLAYRLALLEGPHNRSAAGGLYGDHLRTLAAYPAKLLHLLERLPHADHAHAAAGGIEDRVGILPPKLLDQLVAHGLFAFHAIRLLQRGDVEPSFGRL